MLCASHIPFPMYVPQHYCSSTTPWPSEWFSNSAEELENSQSQPALFFFFCSNPHLLLHYGAATHAKGSEIYFVSIETWNIGCTGDISGGKANQYATTLILSSILKGPMYFDANFPFLPKFTTLSSVTLSETQVTKPKF